MDDFLTRDRKLSRNLQTIAVSEAKYVANNELLNITRPHNYRCAEKITLI